MKIYEFHEVIIKGKLVEIERYRYCDGRKNIKGIVEECKIDSDGNSNITIRLSNDSTQSVKIGEIKTIKVYPEGDRMFFSLENDISI